MKNMKILCYGSLRKRFNEAVSFFKICANGFANCRKDFKSEEEIFFESKSVDEMSHDRIHGYRNICYSALFESRKQPGR